MLEHLTRLFTAGAIANTGLARAVSFGWITAGQYTELTGEPYAPPSDPYKDYHAAVSEELA